MQKPYVIIHTHTSAGGPKGCTRVGVRPACQRERIAWASACLCSGGPRESMNTRIGEGAPIRREV